jgi:hypothetical protein
MKIENTVRSGGESKDFIRNKDFGPQTAGKTGEKPYSG